MRRDPASEVPDLDGLWDRIAAEVVGFQRAEATLWNGRIDYLPPDREQLARGWATADGRLLLSRPLVVEPLQRLYAEGPRALADPKFAQVCWRAIKTDAHEFGHLTAPADWTVADGWSAYKLGADSMATVGVNFDQIANVYADGCQWVQLDPPLGPTVDDLVQAWTNLPGFAATAALDVTVDGYTGKQIEFTLPEYNKDDCRATHFGLWYAGPDPLPGVIPPGFWAQGPDQRTKQWILDVDGTRLVITANSLSSASPQDLADLEEAVASIQIG